MSFNTIKNLGFTLLTLLLVFAVTVGIYFSRSTMQQLNALLEEKAPLQDIVYKTSSDLDSATQQFYNYIRRQKVFREDALLAISQLGNMLSNSKKGNYAVAISSLKKQLNLLSTSSSTQSTLVSLEQDFIEQLLKTNLSIRSDLSLDEKTKAAAENQVVLIEIAFVRLLEKEESNLNPVFSTLETIKSRLQKLQKIDIHSAIAIDYLLAELDYTHTALLEYREVTRYSSNQLMSLTEAEINVLDSWSGMRDSVSEFNNKLRLGINSAQTNMIATNQDQSQFLLLTGLLSVLAGTLISIIIGRILAKRLRSLVLGIRNITDGDFNYRLNMKGKDELAFLANSFDTMSEKLKVKEQALLDQANIDSLTDLPNRRKFQTSIKQAITNAARNQDMVVVMFVDLDNFKRINDSLGHAMGDALLTDVGRKLSENLRGSDMLSLYRSAEHHADLYRLGGDEFVILLRDLHQARDAALIAKRMLTVLSQPTVLNGYNIQVSASIGISAFPQDANDADTLVKHADIAMYYAKDAGKNNYHFYSESMNQLAIRQLQLENKLRKAIESNSFELHYQPQLDVHSNSVKSVEALMRWYDNEEGWISPSEFIPVAENCNLIVELGNWVLEQACQQICKWQSSFPDVRVAVNISSPQFNSPGFIKKITSLFQKYRILPEMFIFELTENIVMEGSERNIRQLNQLKDLGVELSIDDFGTGYSSLSYLKLFPLDEVKIDRNFVEDIVNDNDNRAICNAIIAMSNELGLRVVAEGVETIDQQRYLEECGCDVLQGFFYSKPQPAEKLDYSLFDVSHQYPAEEGAR
ncbi:putative bifunctional diguanylate cyclase/phosphodiesterase [Bacterioplanoides sp.]|uniref:putative bifunctional diguanylate cyclase/phosphodiesterase n=1 Tax=Bacterioplanoides sp. TaxID=2066072 RepID=UPI003B59C9D7